MTGPAPVRAETAGSLTDMYFLSVVIPARNEHENILALLDGIEAALRPMGDHEVIVVDDGSTDAMPQVLRARMAVQPNLCVLRHAACTLALPVWAAPYCGHSCVT